METVEDGRMIFEDGAPSTVGPLKLANGPSRSSSGAGRRSGNRRPRRRRHRDMRVRISRQTIGAFPIRIP